MLRRIHSPVLLANVSDARARAFIALFTCDATARSLVISLLPLLVYAQLGDAQLVTVAYFLVALLGLAATLTVPIILQRVRRRWILTAGATSQIVAAALFAMGTTTWLL